jgi:subtilase family serine protease
MLDLDADGNHLAPDVVWNDGFGAGGGGLSSVFSRPNFQDHVRNVVGSHRGTPDISLSAAVNGAVITFESFDPDNTGFGLVGGTSEASPEFSGIVAMADQVAHRDLGNLNKALYDLARDNSHRTGLVDVTQGNNSFAGVTGFTAGRGYDLASGNGTIDANAFVPALAGRH